MSERLAPRIESPSAPRAESSGLVEHICQTTAHGDNGPFSGKITSSGSRTIHQIRCPSNQPGLHVATSRLPPDPASRRSLPDRADDIGCGLFTLRAFAHAHDIPIRTDADSHDFIDRHPAGGRHPSQFPQPLRDALLETSTRQRLERFVTLAYQPSIDQAARALGCNPPNLHTELPKLERAVGGPLILRHPAARPGGPLTPLGQDLCRQAQEHLGISPILPTA